METRYPKRLEEIRQTLELYEEDRQLVAEELSKEFSIELQGTIYTEKKALDVFNQLLPAPTDGTQKKKSGGIADYPCLLLLHNWAKSLFFLMEKQLTKQQLNAMEQVLLFD